MPSEFSLRKPTLEYAAAASQAGRRVRGAAASAGAVCGAPAAAPQRTPSASVRRCKRCTSTAAADGVRSAAIQPRHDEPQMEHDSMIVPHVQSIFQRTIATSRAANIHALILLGRDMESSCALEHGS